MSPFEPFFRMGSDSSCLDPIFEGLERACNQRQRRMLLDIAETDDAFEIKVDLPGVSKDNIKVDVDGNSLTLAVTSPTQDKSSGASATSDDALDTEVTSATDTAPTKKAATGSRTVHRRERYAEFTFADRTLKLPKTADMDSVNAELDLGVLTVSISKKSEAVTKRRQVTVA